MGNVMKQTEAQDLDHRISTHEEICALRYEQINARLKRLEQIMLGTAGFVIVFLLTHRFM
jgi:hypothetical protein